MKVYEIIEKLMLMPAGARVFVETRKAVKEIDHADLSKDDEVIEVSFQVKNVKKEESSNDVIIVF